MKRRFSAICLCLLMIVSLIPLSAFATTSSDTRNLSSFSPAFTSSNVIAQADKELSYLEDIGLLSNNMGSLIDACITNTSPAYQGAAATIEYTIDYGIFEEIVSFTDFSDSKIAMVSYSEDRSIQNSFERYFNGTAILDGNILTPSLSLSSTASPSGNQRDSDRWFQTTPPYGSTSDYTVSAGNIVIRDIPLTRSLIETTFTIVYQAICVALGADTVFADAFTTAVFASLKATYPNSQGLSCVDRKFWYKTCSSSSAGYIAAYRGYVTSHEINWYPLTDLGGNPVFTRHFEIHKIY